MTQQEDLLIMDTMGSSSTVDICINSWDLYDKIPYFTFKPQFGFQISAQSKQSNLFLSKKLIKQNS